jgi:hypothetical protein
MWLYIATEKQIRTEPLTIVLFPLPLLNGNLYLSQQPHFHNVAELSTFTFKLAEPP